MSITRVFLWIFSLGGMVLGAGAVGGQDYPNKAIRIVTTPPGGGTDFASRVIAQGVTDSVGQQVIVENRAGGLIPGEIVMNAPPDGYTILLSGNALWLAPFLQDNVPWNPLKGFLPITMATNSPNFLVVTPLLPAKSVKELIALAKARPGELNYASSSTGSMQHLAPELFKAMAGVNIARVMYKGTGGALSDLFSGEVQVMFATAASVAPHIKSGRLRALAVTSAHPSPLAQGLPTVAASGLPGYESGSIYGLFAPAKTPAALINRLNREIVRVLNRADVKEKLLNAGQESIGSSPENFTATIKSDMAKWGKLIKDSGIREK